MAMISAQVARISSEQDVSIPSASGDVQGADDLNFTLDLRRLQGLVLLLSCLPPDGKCREIFELALALDHRPIVDRLTPPRVLEEPHGFQSWLESVWIREDLRPEEQEVLWWQNDLDENLGVAIKELRAIEHRLGGRWIVN